MAVRVRARPPAPLALDLLRVPVLGRFLRWKHARTALQSLLLVLGVLVIADGFLGPQLAPENLAGVLPWVQWRGFLVLGLLVAGNLFCMGCPFMLPRRLAKRFLPANRTWPRRLRSKWLAVGLLLLFFWAYETFSLWSSPWLTAWVAVAYFAAAFVIDGLFKGAAFCKYLCPIGQFNFVNSLASPLEIKVRNPTTCASCHTKDCIKGHTNALGRLTQAGCELWLFQERKVGNMDCTFCLDCVHACPHDNVGVFGRLPAAELVRDPWRSGLGRFGERPDLAALVLVLVFGAFMNAFGMVGPFYPLAQAVAGLLHTTSRSVVLFVLFIGGLVALPLVLVGLAAWASRALSHARESVTAIAVRYSYGLAPLGFGMWLAHYNYHFLTGGLTIIPVAQSLFFRLGLPLGRLPLWGLAAVLPLAWVTVLETVFLEAGLLGSGLLLLAIARDRQRGQSRSAWWAVAPWWLLALALFASGWWLVGQPMQMRGTFSVGG